MRRLQASWSAIAGAATTALTALYPSQADGIQGALADFERGYLRSRTGYAYGSRIARYYLCLRCGDGSRTETGGPRGKVCAVLPEPPEDTAFEPYPGPPYEVFQHRPDPVKAAAGPEEEQVLYVPFWGFVRFRPRLVAQSCCLVPHAWPAAQAGDCLPLLLGATHSP